MRRRQLTVVVRAAALAGLAAGTVTMCVTAGHPVAASSTSSPHAASVHALGQARHNDLPASPDLGAAASAGSVAEFAVTLTVDGDQRAIRTAAHTVAQLLGEQGVAVGEHDVVAPAAGSALSDGAAVVVRHAQPLRVSVDGTVTTIWTDQTTVGDALDALGLSSDKATSVVSRSRDIPAGGLSVEVSTEKSVTLVDDGQTTLLRTAQPTVGSALAEAAIFPGPHDVVLPSFQGLVTDGMTITVQRAVTVTITADGTSVKVPTTAATVGEVLAAAGVSVGDGDLLSVPADSAPTDGETVSVVRVTSKNVTVTTAIPHATTQVKDASLPAGQTTVRTAGKDGSSTTDYLVTYHDGKEVSRTKVKTTTVAPVDRVVVVGTKPQSRGPGTPADQLNWAAVAQCESGGDPTLIDGPFYGLYQFMLSTWQWMGGTGLPSNASPAQQKALAIKLYGIEGSKPWPVCGHHLYDN